MIARLHSVMLMPGGDDEVPVHNRPICAIVMIPLAMLMCLAQCAFAAQPYAHEQNSALAVWMVACTLLAFAFPLILLARGRYPELVFWCCCTIVLIFPYDPMLALMAMASLIARRSSRTRTIRTVLAGTAVTLWAQVRDVLQPADASLWHLIFAKPHTGQDGVPIELLTGESTILITAIVVALIEATLATLLGLHIRSRANLKAAQAQTQAASAHAATLQSDLDHQQLSDAIAAEAHDTLAHSLSLLALNASALQVEVGRLEPSASTRDIAGKAENIRRQAAGALDEAHAIIDMLRHPQSAWAQLAPSDETALTRESLNDLIGETRAAGMKLDTWIDIQQLSSLDNHVAKTAYRAVQEGLTNARRHAPGMPVALEVSASPSGGVHVHVSNPVADTGTEMNNDGPSDAHGSMTSAASDAGIPSSPEATSGTGLPGLATRVQASRGSCQYGFDDRHQFHVDVRLPWIAASAR